MRASRLYAQLEPPNFSNCPVLLTVLSPLSAPRLGVRLTATSQAEDTSLSNRALVPSQWGLFSQKKHFVLSGRAKMTRGFRVSYQSLQTFLITGPSQGMGQGLAKICTQNI